MTMTDNRLSILAMTGIILASTVIAFFTPYWLASDQRLYGAEFVRLGLWETCFRSLRGPADVDYRKFYAGCRWIFADEYQNIRGYLMPGFFIATQVLYTVAFVITVVASCFILAIHLCRVTDREYRAFKIISVVMLFASILSTISVIVFGTLGDDANWMPDPDHNFLSWSFGLAVVGAFFSWLSSILCWVESRLLWRRELKARRQTAHTQSAYHPTRGADRMQRHVY